MFIQRIMNSPAIDTVEVSPPHGQVHPRIVMGLSSVFYLYLWIFQIPHFNQVFPIFQWCAEHREALLIKPRQLFVFVCLSLLVI